MTGGATTTSRSYRFSASLLCRTRAMRLAKARFSSRCGSVRLTMAWRVGVWDSKARPGRSASRSRLGGSSALSDRPRTDLRALPDCSKILAREPSAISTHVRLALMVAFPFRAVRAGGWAGDSGSMPGGRLGFELCLSCVPARPSRAEVWPPARGRP